MDDICSLQKSSTLSLPSGLLLLPGMKVNMSNTHFQSREARPAGLSIVYGNHGYLGAVVGVDDDRKTDTCRKSRKTDTRHEQRSPIREESKFIDLSDDSDERPMLIKRIVKFSKNASTTQLRGIYITILRI